MKKRHLLIEFLLIFFFIVLPPVFASKGMPLPGSSLASAAAECVIAFFLQLQHIRAHAFPKRTKKEQFSAAVRGLCWGAVCLGTLMIIFAAVQALSLAAGAGHAAQSPVQFDSAGISAWICMAASLAAGAFFEEVLYRQYLPETVKELAGSGRKAAVWGAELISAAAFALAHRYLGWIAVFNAALCGASLRICREKTGSVYAGAAAHFVYNSTLVLFSVLLEKVV